MKSKIYNILIFVFLGVCLVFVLMNPISQLINKIYSNGVVTVYNNQVKTLDLEQKNAYLKEAEDYNNNLTNNISDCFSPDAFVVDKEYENILNITGDGVMGTITIPNIDVNLPIYHGTEEKNYEKGAVHMANTSLPVGGKNTHSVISAHTAYPGKIFFDKLTDVNLGEYFYITILDKTFAYKVCQIDVVLPNDASLLKIVDGEDLVTLVTCTPYAVNTHRLFVRGQRDLEEEKRINSQNTKINENDTSPKYIIYFSLLFILFVLIFGVLIWMRQYRKYNLRGE